MIRRLLLAVLLVLPPVAAGDAAVVPNHETVSSMNEHDEQALSPEKQLISDAMALARSLRGEDHATLLGRLTSPEFLAELDNEEAYRGRPQRLRLRRILDELARNPTDSAHGVLVALTSNHAFLAEESRIDLLITACAAVKPPPPPVIRFWDRYWQPEDGFANLTVAAVVKNGDAAALDLLENRMADPGFDMEEKLHWLRGPVLRHRLDLPLLLACERMLMGGLPGELPYRLVEALFDYRPGEWYLPSVPYNPPLLETAGEASLRQVERIGRLALERVTLEPELEARVKATLERVEQLLAGK
ncbi:MAG: hypothetical protein ACOY4H_02485 [Thermodesulfobacteriota bacterium]